MIFDLTKAERLEISRRRADLTQREAADLMGLPFFRYKRMERGELEDDPTTPEIKLGVKDLSEPEVCRVYRRREGWTLGDLEALTGLKKKWLHRAETGEAKNIGALVEFWRLRATA